MSKKLRIALICIVKSFATDKWDFIQFAIHVNGNLGKINADFDNTINHFFLMKICLIE